MAAKDTFEAFADIIKDKIDGLSNNASQQNMRAIQSELKAVSYTHLTLPTIYSV